MAKVTEVPDPADTELANSPGPERQELDTFFERQDLIESRRSMNVAKVDDLKLPMSWDSALETLTSIGAVVGTAAEELADEWPEIDKARLVNVECLFITWAISNPLNESFKTPYMTIRGITRGGRRFRFSDGGAGICKQLITFTEKRIKEGVAVPNSGLHLQQGLKSSKYKTLDGEGKTIDVETFYIDNEPPEVPVN